MAWAPKRLNWRHQEILRRTFLGEKGTAIARDLGISQVAVSCLLNSPLAQAELARMKEEADESVTNVPVRQRIQEELVAAGLEAVRINRAIMNDRTVDVKVRTRVGSHFMDRVVFHKAPDEEQEGSYRNMLMKISNIERQLSESTVIPNDKIIDAKAS